MGGGWPQKFCHLSSLCWSWAFLRGCPQEHFLPRASWGSSQSIPATFSGLVCLVSHEKRLEGSPWLSPGALPGVYVHYIRPSFHLPSLPPLLRAWRLVLKEVRGWAHACRLAQHPATLPTSAGSLEGTCRQCLTSAPSLQIKCPPPFSCLESGGGSPASPPLSLDKELRSH